MNNRYRKGPGRLALFLLTVLFAGCSAIKTAQQADTTGLISATTSDIEALYLAWKDFDRSRKDLKFLERGYLFDPDDRQLGYLQKIGLYFQDASVRIHSSWDQLSVLDYVRPERMRDYLTLVDRSLEGTVEEVLYDQRFVAIYAEFIQNSAVRKEIDRVQDQLERAMEALKGVREKILPYTRTGTRIRAHFTYPLVYQS